MTARDASLLLARLERLGVRLGLERMRVLLHRLGEPQARFPAVLVAGTNGKGSTCALLAAMAQAAGYRAGLYSSPHLESVEERIRVAGRAVSAQRLAELLARALGAAERAGEDPPTYFEALTLAAFLHFAEEGVDLAVVEVGMGGRLDATNACEPVLSIVTGIALDHREHLGDTLARIAAEKAGIFRPGRPALAWSADGEVRESLMECARAACAELALLPGDVTIETRESRGWEGQRVTLATPGGGYALDLALAGAHQAGNLALAVRAAETLARLGWSRLNAGAIRGGAAACRWPGRLERVVPAQGSREVLLDAAHNPQGVEALAGFLAEGGEPFAVLFGVLADKDVGAMLPPLAGPAERVFLTAPENARALDPRAMLPLVPPGKAAVHAGVAQALAAALAEGSSRLVVCGSIYLVGAARRWLRDAFGVPAPSSAPLFTDARAR